MEYKVDEAGKKKAICGISLETE